MAPAFEEAGETRFVDAPDGLLALLHEAIAGDVDAADFIRSRLTGDPISLDEFAAQGRIGLPIEHADPAHCLVTGTGLTHVSSAMTRDRMSGREGTSDSLAMYRAGLDGGKPEADAVGTQPEWFFKGLGYSLAPSGGVVDMPGFALSFGEEPEIAGAYVIDDAGRPHRLGYLLMNDFSDHRLEERNYLYVAPSKLHVCGVGPALVLGSLPAAIEGETRILRGGAELWRGAFMTGEAHMNHSFANLEHHHFKHGTLLRPGDLHLHMFGCPRFSFGDGVTLSADDIVEVTVDAFGPLPMRHRIVRSATVEERVLVTGTAR